MGRNSDVPFPDAPSPSGESIPGRPRSRRPSFSFLHRSKSTEPGNDEGDLNRSSSRKSNSGKRSFSGGNRLVKKHVQRDVEEVLRRAKEEIPAVPPIIPSIVQQPQMQSFGGENSRGPRASGGSYTGAGHNVPLRTRAESNPYAKQSIDLGAGGSTSAVPVPPVPMTARSESVDPYARTESMTNRGRYSYASSFTSTINGPRRVRRRKDPTPFNVLVVGASNSGKSSFIDFLRTSCALPKRKQRQSVLNRQNSAIESEHARRSGINTAFQSHFLETEFSDGERIGLTIWDSEGLESNIVAFQLREITAFIESKFEDTYSEETKLMRSPGFRDTHIHCVFLVLDPLRLDLTMATARKALLRSDPSAHARISRAKESDPAVEARILDESLDIQVIRMLQGKTAVIPVISKADTVTGVHMRVLKRSVFNCLKRNGLDPLESLGLELDGDDDDEEDEDEDDEDEEDTDDDDDDEAVDSGNPGSTAFAGLKVHRKKGDRRVSAASARSARTEDSDIVDKAGPAGRKELDPEFMPPLPFSILTPDPPDIHHNESEKAPGNIGRAFPWGFADPYDSTHCDFLRLKEHVFGDWRAELREKSRNVWYENWRTARLRNSTGSAKPSHLNNGASAHKTPRATGSRTNLGSSQASRGLPPTLMVGNAANMAPGSYPSSPASAMRARNASPAVIHPIRDMSPAGNVRGATQYSNGGALSANPASQSRASPLPQNYGQPGTWRAASAQRSGTPTQRPLIPPVSAGNAVGNRMAAARATVPDEVGLAR